MGLLLWLKRAKIGNMKMGRPTEYTKEKADEICEQLISGLSLREICRQSGGAFNMSTIFRWIEANEDFRAQYSRAKKLQVEALVDEMIDIADDGSNDYMQKFDKEGGSLGYFLNGEHVQRSRMRVDTRKWIAAKLVPKVYGEAMTLKGDAENPIATKDVDKSDRAVLEHFTKHYAERLKMTPKEIEDGLDLV